MVTAAVWTMLLPLILLCAAAVDVVRRRPWAYARFALATTWAIWLHVVGLVALWGTWVLGGRWLGMGPDRQRELDTRVQSWWASLLWRGAERVYRIELELRGEEALDGGGFVLMSRHASLLDTILPMVFLGRARGHRLRYVIKRELMWDPCVDISGDRFPTAFVRRGGSDHATEIARVDQLLSDLGERDVVVIYPEGTRFTPSKRERVLRSLERKHPEVAEWAATLRNVLPPHPGGTDALLRSPHDIVFCAHTGLEPANHFVDMLDGSLLDAVVRFQFWRVPVSELPEGEEERHRWLQSWWERIDRWIDDNRVA
jgi:1-acyl-sn-glycerol-3-phosphate acyltransferase